MKSILILGTSAPQVDAIKYCKSKNLKVYSCGHKKIGEGVELADEFKLIDIRDKKKVETYCRNNNIDYIYSVGSEMAMPVANYVSKNLNLPYFIEPKNVDVFKSKQRWKEKLGKDFFANILFNVIKVKEDLLNWDHYPAILKPADGQGQRGVRKVNNSDEALSFFKEVMEYTTNDKILIEEYIEGPELSINAFIIDGEVEFLQESDRISFDKYPGGIIKEHIIPSKHTRNNNDLNDRINEMVNYTIKKLAITNGPVYYQFKIKNNSPKLIEITPRLDGCHMWRLIKNYSGADLLDATFQLLLGNKIKAKNALNSNKNKKSLMLKFLMDKPEAFVNRNKFDVSDSLYYEWYYENNDLIREVNGFIEKVGYKITEV